MASRRPLPRSALIGLLLSLARCGDDSALVGGAGGQGGEGGAGGAPEVLEPLPEVLGLEGFEDLNDDPRVVEVELVAREGSWQIVDGAATTVLAYNDQLPGPLLHARVGDQVIVHFTNELDEATVIHWHGLRISDQMDGSPMIQDPVQPGETFTYDFVVPDAGTFWYHTHFGQIEQLERGLYGAIVVHEDAFPRFSAERIFVGDDIRLDGDNQVAAFNTSGPDVGMGRVGNTLLVNGRGEPSELTIPRGAIERWRFVSAHNSLAYGLQVEGADVRVIATDGGLLPEPLELERVEIAPGQRYDLEVRPHADASDVRLQALILVLDENDQVVEQPFDLAVATVESDVSAEEPVYPEVVLPDATVTPAVEEAWELSGGVVFGSVRFTINGQALSVGEGGPMPHAMIGEYTQGVPVAITLSSDVSPAHPFHVHGQFFQIIARDGRPVFEPGLRDTVHVRGAETATILTYFENPGMWMVHCHISEHSERGMMADLMVVEAESTGHAHE